jgi:subtilisin family serine protease
MKITLIAVSIAACVCVGAALEAAPDDDNSTERYNIVLSTEITAGVLADLEAIGNVKAVFPQINAVNMQLKDEELAELEGLSFVEAVGQDAELTVEGKINEDLGQADLLDGMNTWDMDVLNVTDLGVGRVEPRTGEGVVVAVLDGGLVHNWRAYFPDERILEEYAISFQSDWGLVTDETAQGNVSTQDGKWERDTSGGHGTSVTAAILGYMIQDEDGTLTPVAGVAPLADVLPVKVISNSGGLPISQAIAGILYVAGLKQGPLADRPVVISASWGKGAPTPILRLAIQYALDCGVLYVTGAGNRGSAGMGYPEAYPELISTGGVGFNRQFEAGNQDWWHALDALDPMHAGNILDELFVPNFSGRELPGQELDVLAPSAGILAPSAENEGNLLYRFVRGNSFAAPRVAGIVALMLEKNPHLDQGQAEAILKASAIPVGAGSRLVRRGDGASVLHGWGTDATGEGLITADQALANTPAP